MEDIEFVEFCRKELAKSFKNARAGKKDDKHRYRTEGLMQAARLLGLISKHELEAMMEEEHISVFGETIESRTKRKVVLKSLKEQNPDEYYEIPAIDRKL